MNIIEAVQTRRSIKKFDPNHTLSTQEKREFIELALLSPTAYHLQPNRFLMIEDKALRQQIREFAWNQPQITDSSLLLVLCADLNAWYADNVAQNWQSTDPGVQNWIQEHVKEDFENKPQHQRDEALRSISIAAGQIMITARAMGLDTCAIGGFDYDDVARLINLPDHYIIGMLLPIGKRMGEPYPRHDMIAYDNAVKINRF